jgi:hypothetical protein
MSPILSVSLPGFSRFVFKIPFSSRHDGSDQDTTVNLFHGFPHNGTLAGRRPGRLPHPLVTPTCRRLIDSDSMPPFHRALDISPFLPPSWSSSPCRLKGGRLCHFVFWPVFGGAVPLCFGVYEAIIIRLCLYVPSRHHMHVQPHHCRLPTGASSSLPRRVHLRATPMPPHTGSISPRSTTLPDDIPCESNWPIIVVRRRLLTTGNTRPVRLFTAIKSRATHAYQVGVRV